MLHILLNSSLPDNTDKIVYTNDLNVQSSLDLLNPSMYLSQYEHYTKIVKPVTHNNLINTLLTGYNAHIPVCLRPDDIQMALQMAFATCINNNAEKMRHLFVEHEDKIKLKVYHPSFDMNYFTKTFKELMTKNIKNSDFIKNFCTEYSTTTQLLSTVSNMFLINALKEYFSFEMILSCGIPSVLLKGTQADWHRLKGFYDYFKTLLKDTELKIWFPHFDIILDMFVEMRDLQTDGVVEATPTIKKIWERVISFVPQGSGGDTILGGWARLLVPYSQKNKLIEGLDKPIKCLNIDTPTPSINEKWCSYQEQDILKEYYFASGWNSMQTSYLTTPADFTISLDSSDKTYKVEMYAGFFNPVIKEINSILSVSTNVGFIMREDSVILKEQMKKYYTSLGVKFKNSRSSLEIPITLNDKRDDICDTFNVYSCNWYVIDKEAKIKFYLENGVEKMTCDRKNRFGKVFTTIESLKIPERFRANSNEIFLCFGINCYEKTKCIYYDRTITYFNV